MTGHMTERPRPPIDKLALMLGYEGYRTYFTSVDPVSAYQNSHVVRQAFAAFKIQGAFCLEDGFKTARLKPIVYLASVTSTEELRLLWRSVWSQGSVPFLLVTMGTMGFICPTFGPPPSDLARLSFEVGDIVPNELLPFTKVRLCSSLTWKELDLKIENSVDNALVASIEALNHRARSLYPHLSDQRDLVNSLIGKFLYTYVLIDRGILDKVWLESKALEFSIPPQFIEALFMSALSGGRVEDWTTSAVMAVFNAVDKEINGSVFAISHAQQVSLPDDVCHLMHRVIRRGDVIVEGGEQLSFLDVSFDALRTETISAIYERFVAIEDNVKRRDDGVYYTPPHLADHVLDRVEEVRPIDRMSRVIDVAAGSGIFLVGAFRRLMERNSPAGGWNATHIGLARQLLLSCIHGREKHSQAVNVCRFSLYLTLLDYVARSTIGELSKAAGKDKFLPDLSANIVAADAFALDGTVAMKFTHVIGNPPWSATFGQKDRVNKEKRSVEIDRSLEDFRQRLLQERLPVAHNRLAEYFVWLAKLQLCEPGGVIGMVLPARSFIGRASSRFAHAVAEQISLRWVGNLSHLRMKLFSGARAATCVVVGVNETPNCDDKVSVYRPLLPSLPLGKRSQIWALVAADADIEQVRTAEFQSGPNGWFRPIVLATLDRRLNVALSDWAGLGHKSLGDFLERSGLMISKGGSSLESGIKREGSVSPLTSAELAGVKKDFRGFFAGNVILVPRSMAEATYHRDPIAYSSTYNAIIPIDQFEHFKSDGYGKPYYLAENVRSSLLAYLNSDLLRYFGFLFGATYLMDNARLERGDLLAFPCPFEDIHDEAFLRLGKAKEPDSTILDAMEVGSDFRHAYSEFGSFRRHLADGQMPKNSFNPVDPEHDHPYLRRLLDEIGAAAPGMRPASLRLEHVDDRRIDVHINFGSAPTAKGPSTQLEGRYLSGTMMSIDRQRSTATLSKPRTMFAWTVDQAVADARTLVTEVGAARQ